MTREAVQPAASSGVKQEKVAQVWEEVFVWELLFGIAEAGTELEAVAVGAEAGAGVATEAGIGAVAGQAGADEIAIEAIRRAIRARALKALITYPIRTIVQPLVLMAEMPEDKGERPDRPDRGQMKPPPKGHWHTWTRRVVSPNARQRWMGDDGETYEWDRQEGEWEVFDRTGKRHLGVVRDGKLKSNSHCTR
ncbi:colicin E3/pyocin S6 family cytotoxin [Nostoc sp.]